MLEAKHIIFFVGSAFCVPAGIVAGVFSRWIHRLLFAALIFGTTQPDVLFGLPTDINFMSRDWYRGTTRGIEISYLDLIAVVLLFSSAYRNRREGRPIVWAPSLLPLLCFFTWCLLTLLLFSTPKIFGVFELTKILRGILLFLAVFFTIQKAEDVRFLLVVIAVAINYELFLSLYQRYMAGQHRVSGSFSHPNILSLYALLCLPLFVAVSFADNASRLLRGLCVISFLAAAVCVVLSVSRTGYVGLLFLAPVSFLACSRLRITPVRLGFAGLGMLAVFLIAAKAGDTLMERLESFSIEHEYFSETGDRGRYFRVAGPAIRENPLMGIGLNNWSYWISNRYAHEAGVQTTGTFPVVPYPDTESPPVVHGQFAPAHNLYLLTLTELGLPGLVLLLVLLMRWGAISGYSFISGGNDVVTNVQAGVFLGLLALLMQSWTEWEFRATNMYFLCHILSGVAAAIYARQTAKVRKGVLEAGKVGFA